MYRIYANQHRGAYLRAVLNTIVIPLSTVFTRISAAALINPPNAALIRVITVIGNLRVYYIQGKFLLHLGQNVITFRTFLHLGSFITFRPSTYSLINSNRNRHSPESVANGMKADRYLTCKKSSPNVELSKKSRDASRDHFSYAYQFLNESLLIYMLCCCSLKRTILQTLSWFQFPLCHLVILRN